MLFDLQGRRHRLMQVIYAILAVVMVGGFIFLGIGGTNGSIADIFGSNNDPYSDQIEKAEKDIKANPKNVSAYDRAIQAYSQKANSQTDSKGQLKESSLKDFKKVESLWAKYPNKKAAPGSTLQNVLTVFSSVVNNPNEATNIAELVTLKDPSAASYQNLAYYALIAKQNKKAASAEKQALAKAKTKADKKSITDGLKQVKTQLKAADAAAKESKEKAQAETKK